MSRDARTLIWEGLLNADYMARYYAYLANRLGRRETILTGLVTLFSSAALVVMTTEGWDHQYAVAAWLSLATAIVGSYLFSSRPGRVALLASWEAHRWRGLLREYELLWNKVDQMPESELMSAWAAIEADSEVGTQAAPVEFPKFEKLVRRAQGEVISVRKLARAA